MIPTLLEPLPWAQLHFDAAVLGDPRRNRRLVKVAGQLASDPAASLPTQTASWADLKGAYRLFDAPQVTFAAVATPHWLQTRACDPGRYLILADTTEIDFGWNRQADGLGPVGNGGGRGFLLHSGLLVAAGGAAVFGLAGQVLHYRSATKTLHETRRQRLQRTRESDVWGQLIDAVGPPPAGVDWLYVMDRGGDNFEVWVHAQQQRVGWIGRAAQTHRNVEDAAGNQMPLKTFLKTLPVGGQKTLKLRARPGQAARTATLELRWGTVTMLPPKLRSAWLKQSGVTAVQQQVVWVREVEAPAGIKPLEWILYTSLAVTTLAEAETVVDSYEQRWQIEEWHKALKSGCQVEGRQLQTAARLEPLLGVLGVVAVRLLQLKGLARTEPERPAATVVPPKYVAALWKVRRLRAERPPTVREFFRQLAMLGGFLGRKGDGEPGWITLWRGWEKLHGMLQGAALLADQSDEPCG
jgi:Transposase DNA-binding/Transposase Tn5 dimerisation domain/Transposase DDE domain